MGLIKSRFECSIRGDEGRGEDARSARKLRDLTRRGSESENYEDAEAVDSN